MTLEKREYSDVIIQRTDKCKSHCDNMGGGEANYNKAHGQQDGLVRKKRNEPSLPC